jgi:hypothetical protein
LTFAIIIGIKFHSSSSSSSSSTDTRLSDKKEIQVNIEKNLELLLKKLELSC